MTNSKMENFLDYVAEDSEINANQILDEVMIAGEKEINLIQSIVDIFGDISVTSMSEVTTKKNGDEKAANGKQMAKNEKPWVKVKWDTSGKYIEKLEYWRMTFLKKVKTKKVGRLAGKADRG